MTFNGNLDNFILFERIARERSDIRTLRPHRRDRLPRRLRLGSPRHDAIRL
jgi:hypothetical protein